MLAVELPVGASFAFIVKDCLFNSGVGTTRWEMPPWLLLENRKAMLQLAMGGWHLSPSRPLPGLLL